MPREVIYDVVVCDCVFIESRTFAFVKACIGGFVMACIGKMITLKAYALCLDKLANVYVGSLLHWYHMHVHYCESH